ncbi:unnamed protein product [Clonostachys byssicola]|uniref:Uncharacterized protein n=1 Tax=Clonostachys byssicola TaxID=160290 RepID=A0A9N9UQT1_9HYPO|nr:unnamed protein product [Clonostachys byssicola]
MPALRVVEATPAGASTTSKSRPIQGPQKNPGTTVFHPRRLQATPVSTPSTSLDFLFGPRRWMGRAGLEFPIAPLPTGYLSRPPPASQQGQGPASRSRRRAE